MIHDFRTLLAIVLLPVSGSGYAASTVEHYESLSFWESPVQALMPESPITEAQAKTQTHIRVVRDEQARITEFSYRLGDKVKDVEGFFGNLYLHAPVTRIEYDGSRQTHTFFNRLGHQVEAAGWFKSVYDSDRFGRHQRLWFENSKGERVANGWGVYEYRWHYAADGSVIEDRVDAQGATLPHRPRFEFERIRLTFDYRGYLSSMQNIDASGAPINSTSGAAQYRYFYDRLGRFIRWEIYDAAGKPALGPTQTAGEENDYEGNALASISFFGPNNEPTFHQSGTARWHLQYDQFGNTRQVSYSGLKDEPMPDAYGVGQRRYHYSDDGMFLTSSSYHDTDGNLIAEPEFGFATTRLTRDTQGLVSKREFLDITGAPVDRKDSGVAYETYSYDERGVRTDTRRFTASGEPVPIP